MKKSIIITLALIAISLIGFSQSVSFYTYKADVNTGSLTPYINSKTGAVDSTSAEIRAWFAISGNDYTKGDNDFTKFVSIPITIKGDARVSDFINTAQKVAEAYREKHYPDIK